MKKLQLLTELLRPQTAEYYIRGQKHWLMCLNLILQTACHVTYAMSKNIPLKSRHLVWALPTLGVLVLFRNFSICLGRCTSPWSFHVCEITSCLLVLNVSGETWVIKVLFIHVTSVLLASLLLKHFIKCSSQQSLSRCFYTTSIYVISLSYFPYHMLMNTMKTVYHGIQHLVGRCERVE